MILLHALARALDSLHSRRLSAKTILIFVSAAVALLGGFASSVRADSSFNGKVIGPDKSPVAGAQVCVFIPGSNQAGSTSAITGADGSFSIASSVALGGSCLCVVRAKGFGVGGGILSTTTTSLIQLAPPAALIGAVTDSNHAPVAGAIVSVIFVKKPGAYQIWLMAIPSVATAFMAKTDAHGRYEIDGLPQGATAEVALSDPKYEAVEADEPVGGTAPALIAKPGASISGHVVDPDGKPASGIGLMAIAESQNGFNPSQATSDAVGNFTLGSLKGAIYDIRAIPQPPSANTHGDWVVVPADAIVVKAGTLTKVPDIAIIHGGSINGTITAADTGKPIAGVQVVADGANPQSYVMATTDDEGRFKLVVTPGKLRVIVMTTPDSYLADQQTNSETVGITSGETQQITFQLKHALSVSGTAVDDSGNPVPNLQVMLSATDRGSDWQQHTATTDSSGAFTVSGLGAREYAVSVKGAWKLSSDIITVTPPAAEPLSLSLKHMELKTIGAKAIDQTGAPVVGAQVTFSLATPTGKDYYEGAQETVDSDSQGSFAISDVTPGELIQGVTISKEGYVLISGAKVSGDVDHYTLNDAVLALQNASLSGIVRGPNDQPVAGAWVNSPGAGGPERPVETDASGHFQLASLIDGRIEIDAAKGNLYGSKSVDTAGSASIIVTIGPGLPLAPSDMERAITILDAANSASASVGWYSKGDLAATIGAYNPDRAVRFLQDNGIAPTDDIVQQIISARAVINPKSAAEWGYQHIVAMTDSGPREQAAADIGFGLARSDPAMARKFYELALSNATATDVGFDPENRAMEVAALAAALGRPEARALMQKALADFIAANTNGKGLSKYNSANIVTNVESEFIGIMTAGSTSLATELLPIAAKDQAAWIRSQIVEVASMTDPSAAVAYFDSLDPNGPDSWGYARGAQYVLPIIAKSDPTRALKIANGLTSGAGADARVCVANMLPIAQAAPVYQQASTISLSSQGDGASAGWIAGQAWLRDKPLGTALFSGAFDAIETAADQRAQQGQNYVSVEQSLADFAFYQAREDPGLSRLIIEKEFSQDLKSGQPNDPAEIDAIAMCAVDVDRALSLAYQLPQAYDRVNAARIIASYVLMTPEARLRIRFENWWSGNTWAPGRQVIY